MNNSMVGYVALAVQSFVIFMALSENGGCKRWSDNIPRRRLDSLIVAVETSTLHISYEV